jgi:heat shock protein 4
MLFAYSIEFSRFMSYAYQLVCVAAYFMKVYECFSFPIALTWDADSTKLLDEGVKNQSIVLFPKGNPIPSEKVLIFLISSTFSVDVVLVDVTCLQAATRISTYTVN